MKEIWRDIKNYEGLYEVSNWGRVKSLNYHRTGKERILKPADRGNGYLYVILCKNGKTKNFYVHRLVAEAFIPNTDNLPCVNHKDENPLNCRVENLGWITLEDNFNYGTARERQAKALTGVYNTKKSKRVYQYTLSGEFVREWPSTAEVQRQTGWKQSAIADCCRNVRHHHSAYHYKWSYKK